MLADIFGRLGYMERQGSGLNKIRSAYESAANYRAGMEPEFYSDRVEFMVTLKNLNYKFSSNEAKSEAKNEAKSEAKSEAKNEAELTEIEERICKLIKEEPQITQLQLQERLELSRSEVQRVMKKLREKGVIEHIGSKRSGYWNVDL